MTALPETVQWALLVAPSLLLLNWIVVLLGVAALTWHRREGRWPRWPALSRLAGGIAVNPRTRVRTLWLAIQLLVLDLAACLAATLFR